jgi:hypothetical protein
MEQLKIRRFQKLLKHGRSTSPKPETYKYVEEDRDIIANVSEMKDQALGLRLLNRSLQAQSSSSISTISMHQNEAFGNSLARLDRLREPKQRLRNETGSLYENIVLERMSAKDTVSILKMHSRQIDKTDFAQSIGKLRNVIKN